MLRLGFYNKMYDNTNVLDRTRQKHDMGIRVRWCGYRSVCVPVATTETSLSKTVVLQSVKDCHSVSQSKESVSQYSSIYISIYVKIYTSSIHIGCSAGLPTTVVK